MRELQELIKSYKQLSQPEYMLTVSARDYARKARIYAGKLKTVITKMLTNRVLKDSLSGAVQDFLSMLTGEMSNSKDAKALIVKAEAALNPSTLTKINSSIVAQYRERVGALTSGIASRLIQKQHVLKLRFEVAAKSEKELLKSTEAVTVYVAGKEIRKDTFARIMEEVEKKYGTHADIQYRDGKNYPVTAWVDGRVQTSDVEAARFVSAVGAAKSGIMTLKLSNHSATDSCRYHEDEIVFVNDAAKQRFMALYPDLDVSHWRTLGEVENDNTHMFGFNCKHQANPYPLHMFEPEDVASIVEKNPVREIPAKISEYKLNKRLVNAGRR